MADIKQAAKWMDKGKRVRRKSARKEDGGEHIFSAGPYFGFIHHQRYIQGRRDDLAVDMLETADLLADDWEVV